MKAPWHLWMIGIVTLIWNAFGAADYAMTQFAYEPYMAQFTDEQRTYFNGFPTWVQATWAVAVWLSLAGSLALLMRSKLAGVFFGIALLAMAATFIHNFFLADVTMPEIVGPEALWFTIVIIVVAVLLWLYARAMRLRGVLT
jgi:phosphatidylserine synthase